MKKRMSKKAGILHGTVTFIVLTAILSAALFLFIAWAGSSVSNVQQAYAKQIALLIDQAKPGTNLTIDISELYKIAKKEKYEGKPVEIDYGENKIIIRLAKGEGYNYQFFTKLSSGSVLLDEENKLLKVRV